MSKPLDAAIVGEIFVDHILHGFTHWPTLGEEVYCRQYVREIGGGTANTACALAKLGRRTGIFGCVGAEDAAWIRNRLTSFGVSVENLRTLDTLSGVTVAVSTSDDRTFFTYPGANRELPGILRSPTFHEALAEARHVHFACPILFEDAAALFPKLRAAGCTLSLDAGWHPDWLRMDQTAMLLDMVDWFFPNEKEGAWITGVNEPEDILQRLGSGAVLKLGQAGAAMLNNGAMLTTSAPSATVIDTTGAGDAFDAGFLDAFLDGGNPAEWLRRGVRCGTLSTRAAGALAGLPERKEL
ncbi:MAG TPA: carbohydrate kinase family protein [Bryobacteraceae bacterium]